MYSIYKVKCLECGVEYKQITPTHLKKAHNMSMSEYIEKYNNPTIICEDSKNKKSKNIKITKQCRPQIAWNKGKPKTTQEKLKQSITMKKLYDSGEIVHWNEGNVLSSDHKHKISTALHGHGNFSENSTKKRNMTIQEKVTNGWVSPLKGRNISKEHREKSLIGLQKSNLNKKLKSLELILEICEREKYEILEHDYYYYMIRCVECTSIFTRTRQVFYPSKNGGLNICPTCNPPTFTSNAEIEVLDFIKSITRTIIKPNDRMLLGGKEIDILLEDLNIGFEYCGLYWHSDIFHKSSHLLDKQQHASNIGTRIYTIFEDEWISKQDIVKSRIMNILKISKYRHYARKSNIIKISAKESNIFLNDNHLQGGDKSPIRYGAYIDGILTAVMTFKRSGFIKAKNDSFELNRFCVKKDTSFVGIASKIFKRFTDEYTPTHVISYADYRWSDGVLYANLGFILSHVSPPSPWYFMNGEKRLHRSNFMRHLLKIDDDTPTITKIKSLGYNRIYDCGHQLWEWFSLS